MADSLEMARMDGSGRPIPTSAPGLRYLVIRDSGRLKRIWPSDASAAVCFENGARLALEPALVRGRTNREVAQMAIRSIAHMVGLRRDQVVRVTAVERIVPFIPEAYSVVPGPPRRMRRLTVEDIKEILFREISGESKKNIARAFGVSDVRIGVVCHRYAIRQVKAEGAL